MIEIKILKECGYEEAMIGVSLSHGSTIERVKEIAEKLAHKQGGHNKFLESMMVWLDVRAPRYWWQQADTYRIATKQSESTMHTITKRLLTHEDFAAPLPNWLLDHLNKFIAAKDLDGLKILLPEGFMQRRIWVVSYKTLQNIVSQRSAHKLQEWREFAKIISESLEHSEFIKGK